MYENEGARESSSTDSASAVGVNLPSPLPSRPPLFGVARSHFFFSSWVTKGYAWGVGEGKGSDFGRIQSERPRNRGRALSFMWERCAILGANSSDQFQNHPNNGIIG
jgi:hypothetical protein